MMLVAFRRCRPANPATSSRLPPPYFRSAEPMAGHSAEGRWDGSRPSRITSSTWSRSSARPRGLEEAWHFDRSDAGCLFFAAWCPLSDAHPQAEASWATEGIPEGWHTIQYGDRPLGNLLLIPQRFAMAMQDEGSIQDDAAGKDQWPSRERQRSHHARHRMVTGFRKTTSILLEPRRDPGTARRRFKPKELNRTKDGVRDQIGLAISRLVPN